MEEEDKRLDFDTPLISVRRFSAGAAAGGVSPANPSGPKSGARDPASGRPPPARRSSLPFYRSDLKSGPVRNPGVVPFVWEQYPGHPKDGDGPVPATAGRPPAAPKLPPGRIPNGPKAAALSAKAASSVRTRRPISYEPEIAAGYSPERPKDEEKKPKREEEDEKPIPAAKNCGEEEEDDDDDDDGDAFSDALDTLSRTESFFMNCSLSGVSGIPESGGPSGGFSTDPQVRDFMMGRFLPAAQAVATVSPHYTFRKPPAAARESTRTAERVVGGDHRRPPPLPYQQNPNFALRYGQEHEEVGSFNGDDEEEEEEDYEDAGRSASNACGLLPGFCLKSSFCLLGPVPAMKARGPLPPSPGRKIGSSQMKSLHHGSLPQAEEEYSWEAVYRHKLGRGYQQQGEDGRSKLTSEPYQLTHWSDSQTADGSSPYRRSAAAAGGISPYRNEVPPSPFHEGRGFLGVPRGERKSSRADGSDSYEREGENYWELTPRHSSRRGSGSVSPALERTVCAESVDVPETPDSKSSSLNTAADTRGVTKSSEKDSDLGDVSQRMADSLVVEACERDALQPKASEVVEPYLPFRPAKTNHHETDENNNPKHNTGNVGPPHPGGRGQAKNDVKPLQPLLPPPLPKSPSESWLSRTLPSVSSKNPASLSFLGIQFHPQRQAIRSSANDAKQDSSVKPSKAQHRQTRFAEVLAKPLSPNSEI